MKSICSVDLCERESITRGWCDMHYHRYNRTGSVDIKRERESHGLVHTTEYHIWLMMRSRVHNPNDSGYKDYGGRGITICERWEKSFLNFLHDMGQRPSMKYTLDRINVNGNYEPSNCRWANNHIQGWNKRKRTNNTSGYTGVYENKNPKWNEKRWFAKIRLESGEDLYLGRYDDIEEAALAFDIASIFFRGSGANTNILKIKD